MELSCRETKEGCVGAGTLTEVRVYLNSGVRVMLNGAVFEPTDPGGGTKLVPITYKGSTYLRLRAMAAGIPVTWDGEQPERLRLRELGTGRIIGLNWASRAITYAQKIA